MARSRGLSPLSISGIGAEVGALEEEEEEEEEWQETGTQNEKEKNRRGKIDDASAERGRRAEYKRTPHQIQSHSIRWNGNWISTAPGARDSLPSRGRDAGESDAFHPSNH